VGVGTRVRLVAYSAVGRRSVRRPVGDVVDAIDHAVLREVTRAAASSPSPVAAGSGSYLAQRRIDRPRSFRNDTEGCRDSAVDLRAGTYS
jgi:hypothetical protein